MQVTVEEVSPLTRKLKIELDREQVSREKEAAYRDLGAKVSVKGFRKGKVPRKVLEKSYGAKVEYDLSEKLIKESYFDALEQSRLDAVVHPEVTSQSFTSEGTFVYEADIDIRPQFELGGYKGIEIEQPEIVVPDDEVARELESLRRQNAPLRNVEGDRAIEDGDVAVIDFQGYHEGEAMKQVAGENYTVDVGSGRNGKEFEDNLLGLRKGDETAKEVSFPASFPNPVLAGKTVEFRIKVQEVKERVLPALDDDLAKDVGEDLKSLDDLKEHIRTRSRERKEKARAGDLADQLMGKLLAAHQFEVPQRLVGYEINEIIKEMEANLEQRGLTLESAGMNREQLREQYREVAEKRVRGDFILKKIAEKEEIKVTDEDLQKGFERIGAQYGMPVSEVKKYFGNRNDLLPFMNELLNEKILKFLREEAKVKIVPGAAPGEQTAGE
ncbi:MAG: trigger factor [Desulfobacteraceae bacterium]|nr:trigger factor [Desulfobacteraceae bacterium]